MEVGMKNGFKVLLVVFCVLVLVPTVVCNCSANILADDFENYWTPERLRSAIPREYVMINESSTKPVLAHKYYKNYNNHNHNHESMEVKNVTGDTCFGQTFLNKDKQSYLSNPWQSVGKVFFTMSGSDYVCSGSLGNLATIWTAAHCVWDDDENRWATNLIFIPGYNDGDQPYGSLAANRLCAPPLYQKGNIAYDYALAKFPTNFSPVLNTLTLRVSLNPQAENYASFGYPQAKPFNGAWDNKCEARLCQRDARTKPPTVGIYCDSTGGASGGPWITSGNSIASVNSYGYANQPRVIYGPYFDSETLKFWNHYQ